MTAPQHKNTSIPLDIFQTPEEACDFAAEAIAALIRKKAEQGQKAVLGLATGSTPLKLYQRLIRMHREEGLSFRNVVTFNLDEYCGLPAGHPGSYRHFMNVQLFDHIDIPAEQTHIPSGTLAESEIEASCAAYEQQIKDAGGIDIQILGIGRTGHIGFNEPGSPLESRTRPIHLDPITRTDAAPGFGGLDNVPTHAVTMGIATIMDAREIFLLAWGQNKAEIVAKALSTSPTSDLPASFLQLHRNTRFCVDKAAGSQVA